jgi:16S rRNA (guanine527-N7)-methyltransferase
MHPSRIAELLNPFLGPDNDRRLTPNDLDRISTYIDILLRWNARMNLTAIRDPEEIVTRHFGESLFAARHLFPDVGTGAPGCPPERTSAPATAVGIPAVPAAKRRQNPAHGASRGLGAEREEAPEGRKKTTLADLGSGAGFPGLPIKLWAPQLSLTLLESNHKKATFLREVARVLTLTDINVLNTRAEALLKPKPVDRGSDRQNSNTKTKEVQPDPSPQFDVVTLRAVERFANLLPTAAALVAPAGRLALLIGSSQERGTIASLPALRWHSPIEIPLSTSRILLLGTHEPSK